MDSKNKWKRADAISVLSSSIEANLDRHAYQLCRYVGRADIDLRNYSEYSWYVTQPLSLQQDADLLMPPSTNVIKSCIDSLVSKLANNKTRPFFSPVNGTYSTKRVVRQAQQFFDTYFDHVDMQGIVTQAFRDACVFDIGYIVVDPFNYEVYRVPSYIISTLNTEMQYSSEPSMALIKWKHMPSTMLNKWDVKCGSQYANVEMYFDTNAGEAVLFLDEKPVKTAKIESMPIVQVYYNKPVCGNKTTSVADELEGIQTQIDLINAKVSATSQLTPANMIFIDETGGLKPTDVNNKDAQIYSIGIAPGMSSMPVQVVQPVPLDSKWVDLLDFYMQKAYDMVGISQLSAQSRKPSGLDSGAALATMEDIESDRFETQTTHFVNAFVDIAKKIIEIVPEDKEMLPSSKWSSSLTWGDLKEQSNLFKVQYSAASSLSKDPAERLKQIMQMAQAGLVGADKVAELMDMPDLSDAYNDASAVSMAIQCVVNNAVEYGIVDIPEYINYEQLAKEIASVQNQLYASMRAGSEENMEVAKALENVSALDDALMDILVQNGYISLGDETTASQDITAGPANSAVQPISSVDAMQQAQPPVEQQMEENSAQPSQGAM